jgi:hypothetical protein
MGLNFAYGQALAKAEAIALLRTAFESGLRFFDTDRSGCGQSGARQAHSCRDRIGRNVSAETSSRATAGVSTGPARNPMVECTLARG